MGLTSRSLLKPNNWQDFESEMRELFACILNDPNTQKNGRSGQSQNGVDIYGYRNQETSKLIGVQCKKKFETNVNENELRSEVEKTKKFNPCLTEFFLVTTAPRDQKIQEVVRVLTKELSQTDYPILVYVWGWDDIEEQAIKYPDAIKVIDPTWSPYVEKGIEEIKMQVQKGDGTLLTELTEVKKLLLSNEYLSNNKHLNDHEEATPLHGEITAYQKLVDNGQINMGLRQFLELKEEKWNNASRSEQYRILVGIASANIKLGRQERAAHLLLEAIKGYPEHKNAKRDQATAFLLSGKYEEAINISSEILMADKTNAYIASIFIQALIYDKKCNDPLHSIPGTLHESEEVLIAYIHFLRKRDNNQ